MTILMKWNKKYNYPSSSRSVIRGSRHYNLGQEQLPSVTTILSRTQTQEKRESLQKWKDKIGTDQATRIRDQAAERGTAMHKFLEAHLHGKQRLDLTPIGQEARTMAQQIIEKGLTDLGEFWGTEVTVFYPGLYAGATDLVGMYQGIETICDFKQSNKPKRKEWIEDYFLQLGAYAMAHNYVHNTQITQGVILLCTKDNYFQRFLANGSEFVTYQHKFLARVSQYYEERGKDVA